ncbi:MAG: DsrE family protein [Gammaproteobacteria bacterium]|nr:DsrE family protein [Gammaproteobacteria bacterium]
MSNTRKPVWSFMLLALCLAFSMHTMNMAHADEAADTAKVVYHADYADPQRMSSMLTSIFNMVTTYENEFLDYDVRIVFLSHGIQFLTHDRLKGTPFEVNDEQAKLREDLITRLTTLHDMKNINISLCEITRTAIGLDKDMLIPGVTLVTSGVVEIAKLQSHGFSYLKVQ